MSINCRSCKHFRGSLVVVPGEEPCHSCLTASSGWYPEYEPRSPEAPKKSNADRIRGMTDEELARYLSCVCGEAARARKAYTSFVWETWLKAPAVEDKNEQQE